MTVYGFNRKSDAQNAASNARQNPPSTVAQDAIPFPARCWIVEAPTPDGIAPILGNGKASLTTCDVKYLALDGTIEDQTELGSPATLQTLDVYNPGKTSFQPFELVLVAQVGGRPTVVYDPAAGTVPWMRFRVIAKYQPGIWDVDITLIGSNAPNDAQLGRPPVVGDQVRVHDPNNLFPDIVAANDQQISAFVGGSTGMAYWRDPTNSNNVPDGVSRWEIGSCSTAIDEIRINTGSTCLLATNNNFSGYMTTTDWKRSSGWANVDTPAELVDTVEPGFDYEINGVKNPSKLYAIPDSWVYAKRYNDALPSDPLNAVTPHNYGPTSTTWHVVRVEQKIANWVCATKGAGSGEWTINSFWDGYDPQPCTPTFTSGCFDIACLEQDEVASFAYAPEDNSYRLISTQSAALGTPKTYNVKTGPATFVCDKESGNWCFTQNNQNITAFNCELGKDDTPTPATLVCVDSQSFLDCLDICEYICEFCPEFSGSIICDSLCCCDCEFPAVEPVTDLAGTDGAESANKDGQSLQLDECTFTVPMDNGTSWTVTYECDGDWRIEGELDGTSFTGTGTGDCTGVSSWDDGGSISGILDAAGKDCEDPPPSLCCGECLFIDPFITFTQIITPTETITQDGPATKVDDCTFDVPMDDGSIARVSYGPSGTIGQDGTWTVNGSIATVSGLGDCNGSSSLTGGSGVTGSVTATGDVCDLCCPTWGTNVEIINLETGVPSDVTVGYGQTGPSTRNGCVFTVPIEWNDNGVKQTGTAEVTFDPDADPSEGIGQWTVVPSPLSTPGGSNVPDGTWETTTGANCCGVQTCDTGGVHQCAGPEIASAQFEVVNCSQAGGALRPAGVGPTLSRSRPLGITRSELPEAKRERPGTLLQKRAPELFSTKSGCGCRDAKKLMDAWGCVKTLQSANLIRIVHQFHVETQKSEIESVRGLTPDLIKRIVVAAVQEEQRRKSG